jgi:hypothetical protein
MKNFNDQDRQCVVTLSAAKGLSRWAERCFASLSMTVPTLNIKIHNLLTIAAGAAPKPLYLTVEEGVGSSFLLSYYYMPVYVIGTEHVKVQ